MRKKIIAAIDVGSHALRMKIGEVDKSGEFRELESYRKIAVIGHDTFTKGKVSFETVDKVCDVLKLFKMTFNDYGVEEYMAVATSAIREASNRDYIVDQIRLKTGIELTVISNSQEQYLTHKAVKANLKSYSRLINESAVIVVVGAGSVQITTYREGKLQSSQNVKMGALRIKESFGDIEDQISNYYDIIDEYVSTNLEGVDFFMGHEVYDHLIAVGGEISVINRIVEEEGDKELQVLDSKQFNHLYEEVVNMSNDEIEERYHMKRERADIIVPSMLLFKKFLERVDDDYMVTPRISLSDGIIRQLYEKIYCYNQMADYHEDIITNAEALAKKFFYNEGHSKRVQENALFLFDNLKRLHGMKEERILLQVAAILHDVGKIVSLDRHFFHSYQIIRSLEIFGMSEEQMEIISMTALYHSVVKPESSDYRFMKLPRTLRAKIGKLIAIIRLADAMDRSHKGKLKVYSARLQEKRLIIHCRCAMNVDTTLEEWTFEKKADFFIEVYGITPVLKIKREFSV